MRGASFPAEVRTWGDALWHERADLWLTKLKRGQPVDSEQLKLFLDWALPERCRTRDPPRKVLRAAFAQDVSVHTWKEALHLPKTRWWLSQSDSFVKATGLFAFLDWARAQPAVAAPASATSAPSAAVESQANATAQATCVIYLDAPASHSFVHGETAHQVACSLCAAKWKEQQAAGKGDGCPVCREPVMTVVQNFT